MAPRPGYLRVAMEAEVFFDSYIPDALRQALEYAGADGFVASMPQLLHARTHARYDNVIWNTWFTGNSEECVATTPSGNRMVIAVHGGGIFASPERFERLYRASVARESPDGFTGQFLAKISEGEARELLAGRLPGGRHVPVIPYSEFRRGCKGLPRCYAVALDFKSAAASPSGLLAFDALRDHPLMVIRAGGPEAADAYLEKAQRRHNTSLMGNWHHYRIIDPDQPQARITYLGGNQGGKGGADDNGKVWGYDSDYGLAGDVADHNTIMLNFARYVGVARESPSASLRDLPFS